MVQPSVREKLSLTRWPTQIEAQLQTLANDGERWDAERIEQLVQDLAAFPT